MELQASYAQFRSAGAEIVAVAYQDLAHAQLMAQLMAQLIGAEFPILADTDHAVSSTYQVFDLLGDALTTPAVFVIDRRGRIVWRYVSTAADLRPAPADILAQIPR